MLGIYFSKLFSSNGRVVVEYLISENYCGGIFHFEKTVYHTDIYAASIHIIHEDFLIFAMFFIFFICIVNKGPIPKGPKGLNHPKRSKKYKFV